MKQKQFTKEDLKKINFTIPLTDDEDNIKWNKMFTSLNDNHEILSNATSEQEEILKKVVRKVIPTLNEREQKVLEWLRGSEDATVRNLGETFDTSYSSINRDKERIFEKIRSEYAKSKKV